MTITTPGAKLLRLFDKEERVANIVVDDWHDNAGRAVFTIRADHPRARWLLNKATGTNVSILAMDTEDIEWLLHAVSTGAHRDVEWPHPDHYRAFYRVTLVSRRRWLTETQPDDDYCTKLFGVET